MAKSNELQQNRRQPFFRIITSSEELRKKWTPRDAEEAFVASADPVEQQTRRERIKERTDAHQDIIIKLREIYATKDWGVGEGNFDFLAEKDEVALLHEVKTIEPHNVRDEMRQIIDGIGKLLYYEYHDVPQLVSSSSVEIQKIMVFNYPPSEPEHIEFLRSLGVWVVWVDAKGELDGEVESKKRLLALLA